MATEILINDGGAPARILSPGNANVAMESGLFVDLGASGVIIGPDQEAGSTKQAKPLGILLVDAVAGGVTSVLTGRGSIVNAQAGAVEASAVAAGDNLSVDESGMLERVASSDTVNVIAIALATGFAGTKADGTAAYFIKCLLV